MPEPDWAAAAYRDVSLVTQVGALHADQAGPGDHPAGQPTSSGTKPWLVVSMFRHAMISDRMTVLDVGTGSGYSAALLARRLTDRQVTSIDIDAHIIKAAEERLDAIDVRPTLAALDAAGELPGTFDRIVSMTSVAPVPASWLEALHTGGRLVTTLAGTGLLVTARKHEDGCAYGQTEFDRAGFMTARSGPDYPPSLLEAIPGALDGDAGDVTAGRYPVVDTASAWELFSMLGVTVPGLEHHYRADPGGTRTAWLAHPDGSWARATGQDAGVPLIRQGGPRRLWDITDQIRQAWLTEGGLPAHGAAVTIRPDGSIRLEKGRWHADILAN